MPANCCGNDTCSCLIIAGDGINVSGSGTQQNPYVIESEQPDFSRSFQVADSPSVNLSLTGSGTVDDSFVLRADSILRLIDLTDVNDPAGPSVGDVVTWVGAGSLGHWEFSAPPVAPAGAVNADNGLTGNGSSGSHLKVATSGVWGTGNLAGLGSDSTIGLETYVDSAGVLRVRPVTGTTPAWTDITGKPSVFPTNAASISDPTNINAGKLLGKKITTSTTVGGGTPPATGNTAGDLYFFPKA